MLAAHLRKVRRPLLLLALVLAATCLSTVQAAGGVITCGGFVTASSKLGKLLKKKMDYSTVQMQLRTPDGLLKYSTECAPNGYYFIPVYDAGSYVLEIEGPEGWTFEPSTVAFEIGAGEDENGCAEDINFKFTGFAVSGHVRGSALSDGTCEADVDGGQLGPAGVQLALYAGKKQIAETTSTEGGKFLFPNVFPSTYTVRASHPVLDIEGDGELTAEVEFGNVELDDGFTISGYSVRGRVESFGDGVEGVHVFVFASEGSSVGRDEVQCASANKKQLRLLKDADESARPLCVAKTNEAGDFELEGLPCGQYKLVPLYQRSGTSYVVEPAQVSVSVRHSSEQLAEAFQVMGFSVSGRVVDRSGRGVADATILVNSFEKAVTDANGEYVLERMRTGKYVIKASKPHMVFHDLKNVELTPKDSDLSDITVVAYELCGRVDSGEAVRDRVVSLKGGQLQLETTTDSLGNYCFQVVPGTYTVRPTTTRAERSKGIQLSPPDRTVEVVDAPVLDANFVQARVAVSGSVTCQESCDGISVTLKLVGASASSVGSEHTVELDAAGAFRVDGVFPGDYDITVLQPSWCWNARTQRVTVGFDDLTDIAFEHTGFVLRARASHDVSVRVSGADSKPKLVSLTAGENELCLDKRGVYTLRPESCYRFTKDAYKFDTADAGTELHFRAKEHRIEGEIIIPAGDAAKVGDSIRVDLKRLDDDAQADALQTTKAMYVEDDAADEDDASTTKKQKKSKKKKKKSKKKKKNKKGVAHYKYEFWTPLTEQFTVEPQRTEHLLFYPRTHVTPAVESGCPPSIPTFKARQGLFLTGSVSPSVAGVEILVRAVAAEDADDDSMQGEGVRVYTDDAGTYRAGPLYDDIEYETSAHSQGYHFIEEGDGDFRALRLGQVQVTVRDEQGKPLSDVLLSLSGGEGYRHNNASQADGQFTFDGLFPGQYFLLALLKEYEFSPKHLTIDVEEAAAEQVAFTAKRVAYSVFGQVTSLNGQPQAGVSLEALSVAKGRDGIVEEAVSDANGEFRIRGLVSGEDYYVQVKEGGSSSDSNNDAAAAVARASPTSLPVTLNEDDLRGLKFVVFHQPNKLDLSGTITTADMSHLSSLRIDLFRMKKSRTPIKSISVQPTLPFFEFNGLPAGDYVLHVRSTLSHKTHNHQVQEVMVNLYSSQHVRISFEISPRSAHTDLQHDNISSLVFGLLATLAFVFRENVLDVATVVFRQAKRTLRRR